MDDMEIVGEIISWELKGGKGDPNHATSCEFNLKVGDKNDPGGLTEDYKIVVRNKSLIEDCYLYFKYSGKNPFRIKCTPIKNDGVVYDVYEATEIEMAGLR
ncbi:hypothetical protein FACS1894140_4830 [Spirochaetia bacterium]|nr:hypothetical protein FACS1894140_4830 [Spirochaetia bacterium]